jgi:hypothetical protein
VLIAYQAGGGAEFGRASRLLRVRPELYPPPRRSVTGRFPLALVAAVRPGSLRVSILPAAGFERARVQALADGIVQAFAELGLANGTVHG